MKIDCLRPKHFRQKIRSSEWRLSIKNRISGAQTFSIENSVDLKTEDQWKQNIWGPNIFDRKFCTSEKREYQRKQNLGPKHFRQKILCIWKENYHENRIWGPNIFDRKLCIHLKRQDNQRRKQFLYRKKFIIKDEEVFL